MLPPTLAGSIQRNAIPAKVELEDESGNRIPPEKCDPNTLGNLPDAERSALFALTQWCGGKLTSFLQLNVQQTAELLKMLHQIDCFFPANDPDRSLAWTDSGLSGVSELVGKPEVTKPKPKVREILEGEKRSVTIGLQVKSNMKAPRLKWKDQPNISVSFSQVLNIQIIRKF